MKERDLVVDGQKVRVTEEVYQAYKRPAWREWKKREARVGKEVSLEGLAENGREVPDPGASIEDIVTDKILVEKIIQALQALTEDEKSLISAFFLDRKTAREIARDFGISHTAARKRRAAILLKLKKILE